MAKERKTASELEEAILAELHKIPGCEGVLSVTVMGVSVASWEVYAFNPGKASREDCHRALAEIVPRLQELYSLLIDWGNPVAPQRPRERAS